LASTLPSDILRFPRAADTEKEDGKTYIIAQKEIKWRPRA
jgi:hypothetical protein